MADIDPPRKKPLVKWLAGIMAAVAASLIVAYVTGTWDPFGCSDASTAGELYDRMVGDC